MRDAAGERRLVLEDPVEDGLGRRPGRRCASATSKSNRCANWRSLAARSTTLVTGWLSRPVCELTRRAAGAATLRRTWTTRARPAPPAPSIPTRSDAPDADGRASTPARATTRRRPDAAPAGRVDLAGLSIAGITRRRVGWASTALVALWIVVVFARQVGDARPPRTGRSRSRRTTGRWPGGPGARERAEPHRPARVRRHRGPRRGARATPRRSRSRSTRRCPSPVDGAPGSASVRLGARRIGGRRSSRGCRCSSVRPTEHRRRRRFRDVRMRAKSWRRTAATWRRSTGRR